MSQARTSRNDMLDNALPKQLRSLCQRIEAFEIDEPGVPKPFSVRLATEQCWSLELAAEAIEEYKRFMFLAVAAGHPVTPSATVDEVWHLHLIYSESYWVDFCVNVLDKLIHHKPGNGKDEDAARFARQYALTLQSYRTYFGEPPLAIWGPDNGRNVRLRNAPIVDIDPSHRRDAAH